MIYSISEPSVLNIMIYTVWQCWAQNILQDVVLLCVEVSNELYLLDTGCKCGTECHFHFHPRCDISTCSASFLCFELVSILSMP